MIRAGIRNLLIQVTAAFLGLAAASTVAGAVTVSVVPADTTVLVNDEFIVRVATDAVPDLKGFELIFGFDPTVIQLLDVSPGDVLTGAPGGFVDYTRAEFTAPLDSVWYDAAVLNGSSAGPGILAFFRFKAVAVGNTGIECRLVDFRDSLNVQTLPLCEAGAVTVRPPDCGLVVEKTADPDTVFSTPPGCPSGEALTSISFIYTGSDCSASSHLQGTEASCFDFQPLTEPVQIFYGGSDPNISVTPATASYGDTVTVSTTGASLGPSIYLLVLDGSSPLGVMTRVLQSLTIHTSCSVPLEIGDVFGSLTVALVNGQATPTHKVDYTYTITNNGDALMFVDLFDDVLGFIATGLTLAPGEMQSFNASWEISETTVNKALVYGTLVATGEPCYATTTETVYVLRPAGPSESCSEGRPRALAFQYTGEDCSASNHSQGAAASCTDHAPLGEPVRVVYAGANPQNIIVTPSGETIRIGDELTVVAIGQDTLESITPLQIWQGGTLLQSISVVTNCTVPLNLGDQFGSLLLKDFRTTLDVTEVSAMPASDFVLDPSRPNPSRGRTTLRFTLPSAGSVRMTVHDLQGRLVQTLVQGLYPAGAQTVVWDGKTRNGRRAQAGLYVIRLVSPFGVRLGKVTLLR